MKPTRLILGLIAALGLSACMSVDTASRDRLLPAPQPAVSETPAGDYLHSLQFPYHVTRVDVRVPETLKVSEANSYKPIADIVWREDPFGNRYDQVQTIVQGAADQALANMTMGYPVTVDIQIARFHALTERTRYSVGGRHEISYFIAIYDANSGAVIEPPRLISLNFQAYGGARALEAMSRGETQKVRITSHMIDSIRHEIDYRSLPAPFLPLGLASYGSRGL
ncbi:DUF6778 family protein [Actibacterium sp. XHP0104]|uniref:DUF6778 family protein n=1 Tax=Actibacterium sp. XHP0104 TaxID=2984335 RepID=UPI0021E802BC|nr:DUF6778 family protein [Actibacterium sp. XHP0104]MCV2881544.1 hypothetical protein [Actibacterium sp. XHP0104]